MKRKYERLHLDRDNNKLIRLFKDNGLELSKDEHHEFIMFARKKLERYYSYNIPLPNDIALEIVSDYLDTDKATAQHYFNENREISHRSGSSLAYIVGRNTPRKTAIHISDPEKLEPILKAARMHNIDVRYDTIPSTPSEQDERKYRGPNGTIYRLAMETNNANWLIEESPKKDVLQFNINFDKEFSEHFFSSKNNKPFFNFTVTGNDVIQHAGVKRACSQKKAVGGYSAAEVFKALGVIVDEEKRNKYHLAHRQGHSLGGDQDKDNLDPATAGSNYTTLFSVETFIHELLKKGVEKVDVSGEIDYHPRHKGLPVKITYTVNWGKEEWFRKSIFPLSSRVPTVQEFLNTKALASIAAEITPKNSQARRCLSFFPPEEKQEEQADKVSTPSQSKK